MEPNIFWQETLTVQSSETDFQKRLKLSRFFLWMQDAASTHADSLGFGFEAMAKQDTAWVLSRIKVVFNAVPEMGETVQLRTWPKGIQQKLFFMRDYSLTGENGQVYGLASTAYVVINTRTRRIVPPQMLSIAVPDNNGAYAIDEPLEKVPPVEPLQPCFSVQVGYSSVDILGHVNNARYIDWVTDCFSLEEHRAKKPAWIQINYLNEVKPGETVNLFRGQNPADPRQWYVTATNQNTGAKSFEAEIYLE
jgi:acyl-ACP thioesterase